MVDYFIEQNIEQLKSLVSEIMERKGITLDDLSERMGTDVFMFEERFKETSFAFITEVLFHLGYGLVMTVKPLMRANYEQAENWSND